MVARHHRSPKTEKSASCPNRPQIIARANELPDAISKVALKFDQQAEGYDAGAVIQSAAARWCAEWIETNALYLDALELGAGTGILTRHLAETDFRSLVASDVSPNMVRAGRRSVPQATWQIMDAWAPSSSPVHRLYASSLLQWAPAPSRTLSCWKSLLLPRGRVLTTLFVRGSMKEILNIAPEVSALEWRTSRQWCRLFQRSGFQVLRAETRCFQQRHGQALDAFRNLHAIGAVRAARLGAGTLRSIVRRLDRNHGHGPLTVSWHCLRIEAQLPVRPA